MEIYYGFSEIAHMLDLITKSVPRNCPEALIFNMNCLIPQRPNLAGPADQAGELDYFGIIPQDRRQPVSVLDQLRGRSPGSPGAVAQQFGVLGHDHGQLVAGIGLSKLGGQIPGVEVAVDLGHLVGVGIFPAQLDGGDPPIRVRAEGSRRTGRWRCARPDLTSVDGSHCGSPGRQTSRFSYPIRR